MKLKAHCFKCKNAKGEEIEVVDITIKQVRNSNQLKGKCGTCGGTIATFIKKELAEQIKTQEAQTASTDTTTEAPQTQNPPQSPETQPQSCTPELECPQTD